MAFLALPCRSQPRARPVLHSPSTRPVFVSCLQVPPAPWSLLAGLLHHPLLFRGHLCSFAALARALCALRLPPAILAPVLRPAASPALLCLPLAWVSVRLLLRLAPQLTYFRFAGSRPSLQSRPRSASSHPLRACPRCVPPLLSTAVAPRGVSPNYSYLYVAPPFSPSAAALPCLLL